MMPQKHRSLRLSLSEKHPTMALELPDIQATLLSSAGICRILNTSILFSCHHQCTRSCSNLFCLYSWPATHFQFSHYTDISQIPDFQLIASSSVKSYLPHTNFCHISLHLCLWQSSPSVITILSPLQNAPSISVHYSDTNFFFNFDSNISKY